MSFLGHGYRGCLVAAACLAAAAGAAFLASCGLQVGIPLGLAPFGEVSISASRTGGVAPLCVHFWAEYQGDAGAERSFLDCEYAWDFGDPGGGNWGTNGKPKNSAKGGASAHVFEAPGNYSVRLTVRDRSGIVASGHVTIAVADPDLVYAGERTVCVSDSDDFAGAPAGALHVVTGELADITSYATAGSRVLLRRGSSWTTTGLSWPENSGPVTIGAYGAESATDDFGITDNAPEITVSSGTFLSMNFKQDWRVMDLHLNGPAPSSSGPTSIGGSSEMQRILFLRLRIEGFETGLGWSHWNTPKLMAIDQMALVSCEISGSYTNIAYVGGERLAVLGNRLSDAQESHALRVWQAYRSVISCNIVSGASSSVIDPAAGRHALKLHGPGYSALHGINEYGAPAADTGLLAHRTEFAIVSDNVFGSSGPWPVFIGPQDELTDSVISHIVFERNRICSSYGNGNIPVNTALHAAGGSVVLRNNLFDGTGSDPDYTAISVDRYGSEPPPELVEIYGNTIYRSDNSAGYKRTGIYVGPEALRCSVKDNLISFPGVGESVLAVDVLDRGTDSELSSNLYSSAPGFLDPDNAVPLSRDFRLAAGSPAINVGVRIPVFEDFAGAGRPRTFYDIGAFEWPN